MQTICVVWYYNKTPVFLAFMPLCNPTLHVPVHYTLWESLDSWLNEVTTCNDYDIMISLCEMCTFCKFSLNV